VSQEPPAIVHGIEHEHIDDAQVGNERLLELGIPDVSHHQKFQGDAPLGKRGRAIQGHPPPGVDVFAGPVTLAQRDDLLLSFGRGINGCFRGQAHCGLDPQIVADHFQGPGEQGFEALHPGAEDVLQQGPDISIEWRLGIGMAEEFQEFPAGLRIVGKLHFADEPAPSGLAYGEDKRVRPARKKQIVAVDPPTHSVLRIVEDHEAVHGFDEHEIAQVGEKIWLHDRYAQGSPLS